MHQNRYMNEKTQKRKIQNPRPHERIRELTMEDIFKPNRNFPKFFTIQAENPENDLSRLNVIKANRELIKCLNDSKPKKVDELRNGSLHVEIASEEQSRSIMKLKRLDNVPIVVSEHKYLNQTKGTIYYRNRCEYSNDELLEELAPCKVTDIYRTEKKVNGEQIPNNIYILTFNSCNLPEEINIGWNKCRVKEYIPKPRRCFKCQGFQHSSKNCRKDQDICVNCGHDYHGPICNQPPLCRNCNEEHPASSKDCFYYKLAQEILIIQTKQKVSYREARSQALKYISKPEKLYSHIAKPKVDPPIIIADIPLPNSTEAPMEPKLKRVTTDKPDENNNAKRMKSHGPPPLNG